MNPYREEGSTFESNGKTYDLNLIFAAVQKSPILTIDISKLVWVLKFVSDLDEARIEKADVEVPVLVTSDAGKELVIDGVHRLVKAQRLKMRTLLYHRVGKVLFDSACIIRPNHNFKFPAFTQW